MNNIFIGMLLVFLNFNLNIGASIIGLIPSFIGYIFMYKGLLELSGSGERFQRLLPYAKGMAVYSGICYATDLFGVSSAIGLPPVLVLGLVSLILSLYISYGIIIGIKDIETAKSQNLDSARLYSAWLLLAVFSALSYMFIIVPTLGIVCIIVSIAVGIYYLYVFNKTKNLFYAQNPTA